MTEHRVYTPKRNRERLRAFGGYTLPQGQDPNRLAKSRYTPETPRAGGYGRSPTPHTPDPSVDRATGLLVFSGVLGRLRPKSVQEVSK